MNIFEAEGFIDPEDFIEYDIFELERDDDHVIYLEQPAYILNDLDIICYEGFYCVIEEDGEECADFSLTAVFRNGEYEYWEQDGVAVTLHNYFSYTGESYNLCDIDCKIEIREVSEYES